MTRYLVVTTLILASLVALPPCALHAESWDTHGNNVITGTTPLKLGTFNTSINQPIDFTVGGWKAMRLSNDHGNIEVGHMNSDGNIGFRMTVSHHTHRGVRIVGEGHMHGKDTGLGGGLQLEAVNGVGPDGTRTRPWQILSTGEGATQGIGKLNFRDMGDNSDDLTITSKGRIGIGTTNPGAKVHVRGGDLAVTGKGPGVILTASDDATKCFKITVNSAGVISATAVPCP